MLTSCLCTQRQLESDTFRRWAAELGEPFKLHRKLWEYCYIAQALAERGKLGPGRRGLGFAVGREPLTSLFARYGCEVVATDLGDDPRAAAWAAGGQHAGGPDALNERLLCPPDEFRRRVTFRPVDMNAVPADLTGFDFVWSSCAIEHVGNLDLSKAFLAAMIGCLRPGGVAVHTTEFNLGSNADTLYDGWTALWRRRDLEEVWEGMRRRRHRLADLDLTPGDGPADRHVGDPAADTLPHLRLAVGGYEVTSVGLIFENDGWANRTLWERAREGGAARLRRLLGRPTGAVRRAG